MRGLADPARAHWQLLTVVFIWPISKSAYRKINAPLVRMHWDQVQARPFSQLRRRACLLALARHPAPERDC